MTLGQNTVSGQMLSSFVERVERLRSEKKQIGADEAAVLAEAKAAGFTPGAIKHVVKLRAMKPHARQEAEALVDMYLHALGMAPEAPLFRQIGLMSVDTTSRDAVIEAMKAFVPVDGAITIEAGGRPVRLTRDKEGVVTAVEVVERPPPPKSAQGPLVAPARVEPPNVDPDGAESLGRSAFKDNQPIIGNPFPYGDPRRARWDEGWRKESGTDGMGPGGN